MEDPGVSEVARGSEGEVLLSPSGSHRVIYSIALGYSGVRMEHDMVQQRHASTPSCVLVMEPPALGWALDLGSVCWCFGVDVNLDS